MTHRVVSDNGQESHRLLHRVLVPTVSLRTVRRQLLWMGPSNASRVRGATLRLWDTTLGRAGRQLDHAAEAGSQGVRRDVRIWSCQVSAALLVPSQWVHQCSPQWARWRRLHQDHKNVLASSTGDGNQRRTCRLFLRSCLLVEPFFMPFPPYICFHSLHVLPTSSVSVINNHVPISLPVYPFSNMLLVFTVRVLSLFSEFARISIVVLLSAVVHDKDVKLPPCFFVHHCCRGVFFPLKYI